MDSTEKEIEMAANAIATRIRLPKEEKEKIYTKLVKELFMAIFVLVYFILVNSSCGIVDNNIYTNYIKAFSGIFLCSSIVLFEIAYRKDSGKIAIRSIEILILGVLTLFMPYIYFYRGVLLRILYSLSSMYIAVYYIIKTFIIYNIEVRNYISGLSDIKEIVLEEDVSYLDEINERKFEEVRKFDEEIEKKIENNKKNKKKIDAIRKENNGKYEKETKIKNKDIEETEKTEEKTPIKKKNTRGRKKKEVSALTTNRKNSKENGDKEND